MFESDPTIYKWENDARAYQRKGEHILIFRKKTKAGID